MAEAPHRRPNPARYLLVGAMLLFGWSATAPAQTIIQYPIPTTSSDPHGITTGSDGALWFTEYIGNKIGRITTTGIITEYPTPTSESQPNGITAGPDGALWFTERTSNKIGRITTTGTVTEYPISTAGSLPGGIATGADGALWFTEQGCPGCPPSPTPGKIGRIDTAGTITEYPITSSAGSPLTIAAGSDGALWFTEVTEGGDGIRIGRITTAGAITAEYSVSGANDITSGPDGALWFITNGPGAGGTVGRITTGGTITYFPLPICFECYPTGITTGPDAALWFTVPSGDQSVPDQVGRITTAGVVTEYALPSSGNLPGAITAGPDGATWFVEESGNNINIFATVVLTVAETGTGTGQVSSNPANISCSATSDQCSVPFITGTPVSLTASANPGSVFVGWSGAGCSENGACQVILNSDTTISANFTLTAPTFMLSVVSTGNGSGTVTSAPSGINCGSSCAASFANGTQVILNATAASGSTFVGWSGAGCAGVGSCTVGLTADTAVTANFVADGVIQANLAAAVLPLSRSIEVGATATAFATIINGGPGDASFCSIAPASSVPATFLFQSTDPMTNALTRTPNTLVNIANGSLATFVIAFTPTVAFAPVNIVFTFTCANANPAPNAPGINTLELSASSSPVPDIVALAASGDPGYVDLPGPTGTGDFAVATVNLGSGAQIAVSADTGAASLPVRLLVCPTDPTSGNCLETPAPSLTTTVAANATPTFGIFVTGSASVADMPGVNRVFVTFTDSNGVLRGETSVAVRTQ
jgi:virginiamycin B lyase